MSPLKSSATKKSSKRQHTSSNAFRNDDVVMAPIILERTVELESLQHTFIPEVFKERTWTKLLNPMGNFHAKIIREFFSNAVVEGDRIGCWLRGREFYVIRESIQELLEIRPTNPHTSLQYDERREKLGPIVDILGGEINKKALHTIPFASEMRTLAYIMIFNLYPVKNLTNLSAPRAIFLLDLYTYKEIDICSHIYHLFTKCITKRTTRLILPFPSIIMALITWARVKTPSGLPMMPRDYPISAQTMTQSKAHIPGPSVGIS